MCSADGPAFPALLLLLATGRSSTSTICLESVGLSGVNLDDVLTEALSGGSETLLGVRSAAAGGSLTDFLGVKAALSLVSGVLFTEVGLAGADLGTGADFAGV